MRVPVSWLREYADLPIAATATDVAAALLRAGLEVERVEVVGDLPGVVVGAVTEVEELTGFGKPIRWCHVDVGEPEPRGIVCGAQNFAVGDRVPVALPGALLPGGVQIGARKTYGHVSDGMICSARELGVGADASGILVLPTGSPLGADVTGLLGLRDAVLDIAVTPDRGYCLSVRGVAREAATAYDAPFVDPADVPLPAVAVDNGWPVHLEDTSGCDRYVARLVEDVDAGAPVPVDLARRVVLGGMRSISAAVDVTNEVMLGLGQPLHAFDADLLQGPIVVRRARPAERLTTLDGVDRPLHAEDLVIADDAGALALAGVMGGQRTEVSATTRRVLIESAHFDAATVSRTSRRHGLSSEASRRFERGVDPALGPAAAEVAVRRLVEVSGAVAAPGGTDVSSWTPLPAIELDPALPGRVAGRPYDPAVVQRRLIDVGCQLTGDEVLTVRPPSWRPDLTDPADLVEEVVRLEGYETVPSALPVAPAGYGLTRRQRQLRSAGRHLAEQGYVEVLTSPFLSVAALDRLGVPASGDARRRLVRLANPLAESENMLRTTLLPGLLAALVRNVSRGNADVALCEAGLVFLARPGAVAPHPSVATRPSDAALRELDAALPDQPRHLAVALAGQRVPAGWWGPGRTAAWGDAVAAMCGVASVLRADLSVSQAEHAPWHPGRCAALTVSGHVVGWAGELHPRVLSAWELPARTCAAELDLDALSAAAPPVVAAPLVSAFPLAALDLALVVDATVPVARVESALREGAGGLLESLRLFDVYAGPPVPAGSQSLAFSMRLRAADRTLTADDIAAARTSALDAAARHTGAALRT